MANGIVTALENLVLIRDITTKISNALELEINEDYLAQSASKHYLIIIAGKAKHCNYYSNLLPIKCLNQSAAMHSIDNDTALCVIALIKKFNIKELALQWSIF